MEPTKINIEDLQQKVDVLVNLGMNALLIIIAILGLAAFTSLLVSAIGAWKQSAEKYRDW